MQCSMKAAGAGNSRPIKYLKREGAAQAAPFARRPAALADADAALLEVADRARVEGNGRSARAPVRKLEEGRILVHLHQLVLLLEQDLGDLVDQVLVGLLGH